MTMPHEPAQPQVAILPTLPEPMPEPVQEQPFGPAPEPAPVRKKKTGVVVLSILLVLFFSAAGALGVLLVNEKDHSKAVSEQLAGKERELTDANKKVKDTKDELSKAQDAQKKAEDGQKRAESENTVGTKCKDAARALREAGVNKDETKLRQALSDVFVNC